MRLAAILPALGLCAVLASPVPAASLTKGTVEFETSLDLSHTTYSASAINSFTNFAGTLGAGYSLTPMIQLGGGVLIGHQSQESDSLGSLGFTSYGASGDVTLNFATPNNLLPFVRAGVGFENFTGDGFAGAKTALIAPYLRAGVRVLVGNSASVNASVAYRHVINADGEDGVDANALSFAVGLSIFPIRGK
jgi:hypothetical protein